MHLVYYVTKRGFKPKVYIIWYAHGVVIFCVVVVILSVNTLRPRQNGRRFPDGIFKCIFLNENVWISIKVSLTFVPNGPINNIPALVQIMAWRRSGDKPLSEPMMVSLLTHICVTRPQWVNSDACDLFINNIQGCFHRTRVSTIAVNRSATKVQQRTAMRMKTSSNGNIFRVTGPLWGEFPDHQWIPLTKASDAELCLKFSLICAWRNGLANNPNAGDLRRHRAHYDVTLMASFLKCNVQPVLEGSTWSNDSWVCQDSFVCQ